MLISNKEQLKTTRKLLQMTQQELGKEIGLTREFMGRMERGEESIDLRTSLAVECLFLRKKIKSPP